MGIGHSNQAMPFKRSVSGRRKSRYKIKPILVKIPTKWYKEILKILAVMIQKEDYIAIPELTKKKGVMPSVNKLIQWAIYQQFIKPSQKNPDELYLDDIDNLWGRKS